jgi:glycosyltransferase involved in cell wall biosynthesis
VGNTVKIAVVVPCYRVKGQVLEVIANIGPEATWIICVDDACPDGSGEWIETRARDPRLRVIRLPENRGVGGAVMAGYRAALDMGADVVVKLDGDGQMDPGLIPTFVRPIAEGLTDYAKGNRFFNLEDVKRMPVLRLIGNTALSFFAKFSTGYWDILDPTNGYTAIHAKVLRMLPMEKISQRWFFETDMLFRLNTVRAVVMDIPMTAVYGNEKSNLNIGRIISEFLLKHVRNYCKRIFYNYFLRNFSIASIELLIGITLTAFGVIFSISKWRQSVELGQYASAGTVMIGALAIIIGFELLLAFLNEDMRSTPRIPLQGRLH